MEPLSAPLASQVVSFLRGNNSGIGPEQIGFIEAHGTATSLGDPIEVGAVTKALGKDRGGNPLLIASLKTNIGHLEAASGIAALIKTTLSLQRQSIPASLHFQKLNPRIPTHGVDLKIPQALTPWPGQVGHRLAGINSFGFGGTNAHAILGDYVQTPSVKHTTERPRHLLPLSAKSPQALTTLAESYDTFLAGYTGSIADLCHTAASGRAQLPYRLAVTGENANDLRQQLATMLDAHTTRKPTVDAPAIGFLFTGQGSQYAGMGRELYETQPTFRHLLDECDAILKDFLPTPLLSVLFPEPLHKDTIHQTQYTQPALFALEYALARLWQSWGINPSLVMGHSVGEYVAACMAGVFSLEDGLRLIAKRGALIQSLPAGGKMAAIFAAADRLTPFLKQHELKVSIAAFNSPNETVITGDGHAIDLIMQDLRSRGIAGQPLPVSHAFHSPLLDPMLDAFHQEAVKVRYAVPQIPIISNLTGELYDDSKPVDAEYWTNHVRHGVQFATSIKAASQFGCRTYLEIGPHATLINLGRRCLTGDSASWLSSLKRGSNDWQCILDSLANLYQAGFHIDWKGFDEYYTRSRVDAPLYPFQRQRYWVDQRPGAKLEATPATTLETQDNEIHPLLGTLISSPLPIRQYSKRLSSLQPAMLADHQINGRVLFPAAGYLELALAAAATVGFSKCSINNVAIEKALVLNEKPSTLQTTMQQVEVSNSWEFTCFTPDDLSATTWTRLAKGTILPMDHTAKQQASALPEKRTKLVSLDVEHFYKNLAERGYQYGPSFRPILELQVADELVTAKLEIPDELADIYCLSPVLADGCLQAMLALPAISPDLNYLPIGWGSFRWYGRTPSNTLQIRVEKQASTNSASDSLLLAHLLLIDTTGEVIGEWKEIRFQAVRQARENAIITVAPEHHKPAASTNGKAEEYQAFLLSRLREIMALPDDAPLSADTSFADLGIDSLMATDLHFTVEKLAKSKLPESLMQEHSSVKKLSLFLITRA